MPPGSLLPLNPPSGLLGVRNAVLTGTSRRYHVSDFEGSLSIKTVSASQAIWQADGRRFVVREDCCLVLNDRQRYTIDIETAVPATTFCLFFARGFVEDIWRATVCSDRALLDEPTRSSDEPCCGFFQRLEHGNHPVLARVRQFQRTILAGGPDAAENWEAHFLAVAVELVHAQRGVLRAAESLPALRASTRLELCKRLLRGRDLLLSSRHRPPSLRELAAAACLSPYHFHRSFTRFFGQTPHRLLTDCRLERIAARLRQSDRSILELCLDEGFQSPASFSSLFLRRYGQSPSAYRRSHREMICGFARSEKKIPGEVG